MKTRNEKKEEVCLFVLYHEVQRTKLVMRRSSLGLGRGVVLMGWVASSTRESGFGGFSRAKNKRGGRFCRVAAIGVMGWEPGVVELVVGGW